MAKPQQQRDQETKLRREKAGEVELRHRVRPGIIAALEELMSWGEYKEITECLQTMILNVRAIGKEGAADLLKPPRHEIHISEKVARRFQEESRRELRRDPGDS